MQRAGDDYTSMLRQKQFYLGYMAKRLLFAYLGLDERETSKDSYQLRRVQSSGEMLAEVFRYEYFQLGNKYREYVANGMRHQGETCAVQNAASSDGGAHQPL